MESLWINEIEFNFDVEKTSKLHPKGTKEYRDNFLKENEHIQKTKKRIWNVRFMSEIGKKVLKGDLFQSCNFMFSYEKLIILSDDPKIYKYIDCKVHKSHTNYLFSNTFYDVIWLTLDKNNNVISIFK